MRKFFRIFIFPSCPHHLELTGGGRTRWRRSRCTWNTSLSRDASGTHLQTQKHMQNASWERTGLPDQQKRMYRPMQNSVGWRKFGGNGSVGRTGLPSAGGGTEAGVWPPHWDKCLCQRRNKAERGRADPWQPDSNENQPVLAAAVRSPDDTARGAGV